MWRSIPLSCHLAKYEACHFYTWVSVWIKPTRHANLFALELLVVWSSLLLEPTRLAFPFSFSLCARLLWGLKFALKYDGVQSSKSCTYTQETMQILTDGWVRSCESDQLMQCLCSFRERETWWVGVITHSFYEDLRDNMINDNNDCVCVCMCVCVCVCVGGVVACCRHMYHVWWVLLSKTTMTAWQRVCEVRLFCMECHS